MILIYAERKVCYLLKGLFFAIKLDGWIKGKGRISLEAHFKVSIRDISLQIFPLNRRQSIMPLSLDLNSVFSYGYKDGESFPLVLMLARYASHCQIPFKQKVHLSFYALLSLLCTLIQSILKTSLSSALFFSHDFSRTVSFLLIQRITTQALLVGDLPSSFSKMNEDSWNSFVIAAFLLLVFMLFLYYALFLQSAFHSLLSQAMQDHRNKSWWW